jgi:adenosylhomocysteine nucleosidase
MEFRREFRPHQRFPGAPCRARFCGPAWLSVLLLETGPGAARAEQAVQWLLAEPRLGNVPYRPRVVLSAGFAGALRDTYRVGDVVLASEVVDGEGGRWPVTWPDPLPGGEWRPPLHRDRLLTTSAVVARPEDKQALGRRHEAGVVDMESAVVGRACSGRGVPFGCVRAVSDRHDTPLSAAVVRSVRSGRVSVTHLGLELLRSPRLAGELWRLARDTRLAARQLGQALGELLTLALPWGQDL